MVPVILAGGRGTRLWPLSRQAHPKQFNDLIGDRSLFMHCLQRAQRLSKHAPLVLCHERHRFLVAEQLRQANCEAQCVILEPESKNTAPAIAAAIIQSLEKLAEDTLFVVLPADQLVVNEDKWCKALEAGIEWAQRDYAVCLGIEPTKADTNYGYIHRGELLSTGAHRINGFKEKPNLATAKTYLDSKEYVWNAGVFLFKAATYLKLLKEHAPDVLSAVSDAVHHAEKDLDFLRLNKSDYQRSPNISIDYAVMEHIEQGVVLPVDCGWSDLGNWETLWNALEHDKDGNALQGDVVALNSKNNLLLAQSKLLATVNVENLVVVETEDAVLVSSKSSPEDMKLLCQKLEDAKRTEITDFVKVYRPWGHYQSLAQGDTYQVKRIVVAAGHRLSLQYHHHRAEHWVVVTGVAEIQIDDRTFKLKAGGSTFIPIKSKHRLINNGPEELELIEVQSGTYLGEDDIVRLEDIYGRTSSS